MSAAATAAATPEQPKFVNLTGETLHVRTGPPSSRPRRGSPPTTVRWPSAGQLNVGTNTASFDPHAPVLVATAAVDGDALPTTFSVPIVNEFVVFMLLLDDGVEFVPRDDCVYVVTTHVASCLLGAAREGAPVPSVRIATPVGDRAGRDNAFYVRALRRFDVEPRRNLNE